MISLRNFLLVSSITCFISYKVFNNKIKLKNREEKVLHIEKDKCDLDMELFYIACDKNYLEIIRYLLEKYNKDNNINLDIALEIAIKNNFYDIVEYIINNYSNYDLDIAYQVSKLYYLSNEKIPNKILNFLNKSKNKKNLNINSYSYGTYQKIEYKNPFKNLFDKI